MDKYVTFVENKTPINILGSHFLNNGDQNTDLLYSRCSENEVIIKGNFSAKIFDQYNEVLFTSYKEQFSN